MSWNADTNRDVLKRIAALLFALAELADRASLAPRPVRAHVLGILRPAEVVAHAFVIGMARDPGATMLPQASLGGDDPDDATRLALGLRTLALALASLSARAECSASHGSGHIAAAKIEKLRKRGQLAVRRSQGAVTPDTS